jgi:hypothetical protein
MDELKQQIKTLKSEVAALPPLDHSNAAINGKVRKDLADKMEEYELLKEQDRVASVVDKYNLGEFETHRCPFCYDDVRLFDALSGSRFICCGNIVCMPCTQRQEVLSLRTCPFCRTAMHGGWADRSRVSAFVRGCADRGMARAQFDLAVGYVLLNIVFLVSSRLTS